MRKIGRNIVAAFLIIGLMSSALSLDAEQGFDSEIIKEMNLNNIPSIAACILKDDEIVWENAYGLADIDSDREATTGTIYLLASVSKLVIATAVMQLVEQGLIDLDDDISLYLPWEIRNPHYPENKITMRLLMTHSSSLAGPKTDEELPGFYDWYPPDTQPGLMETLQDYLLPGGRYYVPNVWTEAAPGERELYSNLGIALAGFIVEYVSGEELNTYCTNHIFLPLDMTDTSFVMGDLDETKVATRYGEYSNPFIHYSRRDYPGGQLKSSVRDFSHFLMAYMNGGRYRGQRIVEENTIEEMLKIHNPASGLCLIWNRTVGGWFGHSGGENGASTYVEYQKEDRVGLIIFANTYLGEKNPVYPPRGKIYGLIRKKANTFRDSVSGFEGRRDISSNFSFFRVKK